VKALPGPKLDLPGIYRDGGMAAIGALFDGYRGSLESFQAIGCQPRAGEIDEFDVEADRAFLICDQIAGYLMARETFADFDKCIAAAIVADWCRISGELVTELVARVARIAALPDETSAEL